MTKRANLGVVALAASSLVLGCAPTKKPSALPSWVPDPGPSSCLDASGNVIPDSVIAPEARDLEVEPPKVLERIFPRTDQAGDNCAKGSKVVLRSILRASGKICGVEVVSFDSGCDVFAKEAARVVSEWSFRPARRDGVPVPVYYNLLVRR